MICHRRNWTSCWLLLKRRRRVTCRVARAIYSGHYMTRSMEFIVFLVESLSSLLGWVWGLATSVASRHALEG